MRVEEAFSILSKKIKEMQSPDVPDTPTYEGEKYSYEERQVGTWVDGKPLYERTVDFGALPNNDTKTVPHGVGSVSEIWLHGGYAFDDNGSYQLNVPSQFSNLPGENTSYAWRTTVTKQNIFIETSEDKSTVSAVVIIRYTKTTD